MARALRHHGHSVVSGQALRGDWKYSSDSLQGACRPEICIKQDNSAPSSPHYPYTPALGSVARPSLPHPLLRLLKPP